MQKTYNNAYEKNHLDQKRCLNQDCNIKSDKACHLADIIFIAIQDVKETEQILLFKIIF